MAIGLDSTFLTNKWGPLPAWAWMGLGLGGALAIASWRSSQAKSGQGKPAGDAVAQNYQLPDSLQPSYAFVEGNTTIINTPPGGGRNRGPLVPAPPVTAPPTEPPPVVPTQPPPPAAPAGQYVTTVKWASGQPKGTPSTLWGIAEKFYGNGSGWQQIWSAPQNAAIRAKRGAPEKIQPGDSIWVPTK